MSKQYPRYFTVNDRPVKFIRTPDGSMDVLALNMSTGEFVRELEQLDTIYEGGRDVDILSEGEFEKLVQWHRSRL